MTTSAELKSRLQAGVTELEQDIAKLKAAIRALDGADKSQRPGRGTSKRSPRAESAAKPEVVPAGKLSALLGNSEGLTTAELARQTNGAPGQVLQMLKELEQAGRAHRSGRRRSTRWHAGGQDAPATSATATPMPKRARRKPSASAGDETAVSERDRQRAAATSHAEEQLAAALDPFVAS